MNKKSETDAQTSTATAVACSALLAAVERHGMNLSPSTGGWAIWCETEGREGRAIVVRTWKPTLVEAILDMDERMSS